MTTLRQSRSLLVVLIVVGIVLVTRLGGTLLSQTTGKVDPHVNLARDRLREILATQRQQQLVAFQAVTEGEVFRTEQRIREATALATAMSLVAARAVLNGRIPTDHRALTDTTFKTGMIPPGLQAGESDGSIGSVNAKLFVRYRPEPLAIEVLSIGKDRLDGPVILIRVLCEDSRDINHPSANIFVANTLDLPTLPSAFMKESELLVLGFTSQQIREAKGQR